MICIRNNQARKSRQTTNRKKWNIMEKTTNLFNNYKYEEILNNFFNSFFYRFLILKRITHLEVFACLSARKY